MPSVGPMEIVIALILALIVFGPKRLPDLGRSVGKGMREFKGALTSATPDEQAQERPAREHT
ncbi:MAG: twin-arginine translocase TatA/TatE family subunit [Thermoleophilaceae bacterium]|nr:twin-arginine translocase TatA/TatE family subunit [Thermoleophilaceae bacterium]